MRQANLRAITAKPPVVTIPVNPPGGVGTLVVTQPPPERVPVYQNAAHTFNIPVNGRAQPEMDDHQDGFFTTRDDSVYDAFGPSPTDFDRRFRMMEDKLKAIEGPDTFGKIIKERAFNLHPDQHHDIHAVLKHHKLTYLNSQIQPAIKDLVLEFYANSYRPSFEDAAAEPELTFWVRGQQIQYDWKMVNMLLKMKFRETNCEYQLMKMSSRTCWPYRAMLDCLALEERDWKPLLLLRFLENWLKAGVPEFTNGHIVNLARPLDVGWITEHPMKKAPIKEGPEAHEHLAKPTGSSRHQPKPQS
ncbi:hypothetical protein KIW84_033293 [Lathyrus oleraceus]|uniref:Uncharacterized protein n=1 Tax=Pisum sativum TaxID=3888 RepID=A0A9D4Y093_PEA|nr:hypothetical protein KIW84_033293 [Pisum sativum]